MGWSDKMVRMIRSQNFDPSYLIWLLMHQMQDITLQLRWTLAMSLGAFSTLLAIAVEQVSGHVRHYPASGAFRSLKI